jgi:hypothetical protein
MSARPVVGRKTLWGAPTRGSGRTLPQHPRKANRPSGGPRPATAGAARRRAALHGRGGLISRTAARFQQSEDDLIGRALHRHKLHLSEVYGLGRDQSGRIFLKNDRLVFHEGE